MKWITALLLAALLLNGCAKPDAELQLPRDGNGAEQSNLPAAGQEEARMPETENIYVTVPEEAVPSETPEHEPEPSEQPAERGDLIDMEDLLSDPESHYVFQPKVSSVYLEEIFGETMCETWFHLVDAVMAGEDTFACPDQFTYDWVMGQFPERCFPVLTELIGYAWDRENSVTGGIASFTYLVPREQAKERIAAFAQQIEGILNDALEDDYSDLEKCLALYDYFMKHYVYDYETFERMADTYIEEISCIRFFNEGTGVCQEISTAYSYLLMQAGVDATTMSGERSYDRAGHQWSYVRIDGKDYHIDPTYALGDFGSLSYFMMTDGQREAEDCYEKQDFHICSVYTQEYPHPEYSADDDTFRPLWGRTLEALFPSEDTILCWAYTENWDMEYLEYNYADHSSRTWIKENSFADVYPEEEPFGDV